jgi:thioredoxin reductase/SAM-dependent methyltransferase
MNNTYDMVVVGGGAAGMSGAKIAARMRRRVLVIDAGSPRNAPAQGVHNYLYAEGSAPAELRVRARAEAEAYDVEVVEGSAVGAVVLRDPEPTAARFTVDVRSGDGSIVTVGARRLLLATGLVDVLPQVDGLAERWGRDVLHCPFCHGWEVRDQAIGVLGTSPMAVHQVLLFRQLSEDVVYFQHTAPDPSDEQVEQLAALGVPWVVGLVTAVTTTNGALSGVRMADGRVIARQAVAVATGLNGREDLDADLGLSMSDLEMGGTVLGRYLPIDATGATATPGVWAAGNLAAPMAQVITSAAAGAAAGSSIHMDLMGEDVAAAVNTHRAHSASAQRTGRAMDTGHPMGTSFWGHREARVEPASQTTAARGANSAAARAAAERAAAAKDAEAFWEPHYASNKIGSVVPNAVLVDVIADQAPGRALDLGCGQGGDVLWLAGRGWEVTGVDVSSTALQRVVDLAADQGLSERVRVQQHDLSATFPPGTFDLVTASYFHSPVAMDRPAVLARAATAVAPGGILLVVDHASVPPWSWADPDSTFPTPQQTLEGFGLDPGEWDVAIAEDRERPATGPGGQHATVTDTVIAVVRRAATPTARETR